MLQAACGCWCRDASESQLGFVKKSVAFAPPATSPGAGPDLAVTRKHSAAMSDTFNCCGLHQSQSADWSSVSTSSWVDLGDHCNQQSPDLSSSQLDRLQLSSSFSSSCDTNMSVSPDQLKAKQCPLHCAEDDVNNFTASPQNSDVSALSYQNPAYFAQAMANNSKQELTPPAVKVELATVPCLAEVPTEAITETTNVACYGKHAATVHGLDAVDSYITVQSLP